MHPEDQAYYRKREADERAAAERAEPIARRAHHDLADLYAARLRDDDCDPPERG